MFYTKLCRFYKNLKTNIILNKKRFYIFYFLLYRRCGKLYRLVEIFIIMEVFKEALKDAIVKESIKRKSEISWLYANITC